MITVAKTGAAEFSLRSPLASQLRAGITSLVDGKSFRDALTGIASQARINLWIDRQIDPTTPIAPGPVGPTVFAAIEKIAAQRECVVMPVADVVLIGRPKWVDRTAASILLMNGSRGPNVDVSWEDLSTPAEAMARIYGADQIRVQPEMPHDLWPANTWKRIDRGVAAALVLAQFDRKPKLPDINAELQSTPMDTDTVCTQTYFVDPLSTTFRESMRKADSTSQTTSLKNGRIRATGTAAAHRTAIAQILRQPPRPAAAPQNAKFTLKASAPAEALLMKLAQSAQLKCVINPNAKAACEKVVTIEAQNATLNELIEQVARSAGVVATWKQNTLEISVR